MDDDAAHNDDGIGRLREIAQQASFQHSLHMLPIVRQSADRSLDLLRDIMIHSDAGERTFKDMIDDFVRLIEKKLSDAEFKLFDAKYVRQVIDINPA